MEANQEAKPRIYEREEYAAAVRDAQEFTDAIGQMMPAAAALYASAYRAEAMPQSVVVDQIFNLAVAMATRLKDHVALDVARLTQAKEDSGL